MRKDWTNWNKDENIDEKYHSADSASKVLFKTGAQESAWKCDLLICFSQNAMLRRFFEWVIKLLLLLGHESPVKFVSKVSQ